MTGVQPTEFTIIENGKRVKYLREGECNLCGACCCKNTIVVNITAGAGNEHYDEDEKTDWSKWEGYSEFESQGIYWWIKLYVKDEMMESGGCPRLIDGKCADWMTREFKAVCRYFPVHPSDIAKFPECGFSFRRVDND